MWSQSLLLVCLLAVSVECRHHAKKEHLSAEEQAHFSSDKQRIKAMKANLTRSNNQFMTASNAYMAKAANDLAIAASIQQNMMTKAQGKLPGFYEKNADAQSRFKASENGLIANYQNKQKLHEIDLNLIQIHQSNDLSHIIKQQQEQQEAGIEKIIAKVQAKNKAIALKNAKDRAKLKLIQEQADKKLDEKVKEKAELIEVKNVTEAKNVTKKITHDKNAKDMAKLKLIQEQVDKKLDERGKEKAEFIAEFIEVKNVAKVKNVTKKITHHKKRHHVHHSKTSKK